MYYKGLKLLFGVIKDMKRLINLLMLLILKIELIY